MIFVCPKCGKALSSEACSLSASAARCPEGHSYDRAKEGYYNLLLTSVGGVHGDDRMMVEARRDFLSRGYYEKLADAAARIAREVTPPGGVLLDAGCGEGYYTARFAEALFSLDPPVRVAGFDISKDAARIAAKRDRRAEIAVASAYAMPIAEKSVDAVVNMFSPLALDEVRRVLRPGGAFLCVIPGEEHLFGLKEKIYDTPYKNTVADPALEGFRLVKTERLTYEMALDGKEAIRSLFLMTPYAYRTPPEGRARVEALERLSTLADFYLFTYRRI